MSTLLDTIHGWSIASVFLRLLLAMFVGLIIGLERDYRNRGAGIKTHILVCLGAALAMIVGQYLMIQFPSDASAAARLGAQVISGVGFLGVGTIIVTGVNEVRGLSTASGLWACACTGLAAGIGFVEGTLITLILIVITYIVIGKADMKLKQLFSKECNLYIELSENAALRDFFFLLHRHHVKILHFEQGTDGSLISATLLLELPKRGKSNEFIDFLKEQDCVSFAEEL